MGWDTPATTLGPGILRLRPARPPPKPLCRAEHGSGRTMAQPAVPISPLLRQRVPIPQSITHVCHVLLRLFIFSTTMYGATDTPRRPPSRHRHPRPRAADLHSAPGRSARPVGRDQLPRPDPAGGSPAGIKRPSAYGKREALGFAHSGSKCKTFATWPLPARVSRTMFGATVDARGQRGPSACSGPGIIPPAQRRRPGPSPPPGRKPSGSPPYHAPNPRP